MVQNVRNISPWVEYYPHHDVYIVYIYIVYHIDLQSIAPRIKLMMIREMKYYGLILGWCPLCLSIFFRFFPNEMSLDRVSHDFLGWVGRYDLVKWLFSKVFLYEANYCYFYDVIKSSNSRDSFSLSSGNKIVRYVSKCRNPCSKKLWI